MSLVWAGEGPGLWGGFWAQGCWGAPHPAAHPGPGRTRNFHPREELPYSRAGVLVEESSVYIKVDVRLVLTFLWNREEAALVRTPPPVRPPPQLGTASQRLELPLFCPQLELDPKYANQTCGLCGDFNGLRAVNEFYAHSECPLGQQEAEGWLVLRRPGGGSLGVALPRLWVESKSGWGQYSRQRCPREVSGALGTGRGPQAAIPCTGPTVPQHPDPSISPQTPG